MAILTAYARTGLALLAVFACTSSIGAQAQPRPRFVAESIRDFATAYAERHHGALDARHEDASKYHAFRLASSEPSAVVIARRIWTDANGRLHIVGEPGTSMKGGGPGGPGFLHILLPVGVEPPR
jgi:hypothetical protein